LLEVKSQQIKYDTDKLIGAPTDKLLENIFSMNMFIF